MRPQRRRKWNGKNEFLWGTTYLTSSMKNPSIMRLSLTAGLLHTGHIHWNQDLSFWRGSVTSFLQNNWIHSSWITAWIRFVYTGVAFSLLSLHASWFFSSTPHSRVLNMLERNSVADPHLLLCGCGSEIKKMSIWIQILGGKD